MLPRRRVGTRIASADSPPAAIEAGGSARPGRDGFQVAARRAAGVRERDAKHGLAARERRFGAGGAHDERLEIAVAGMHRDDAERGEQEGEAEAEVIAVVERAEQHREQHQPEGGAEAGRQDVDAAAAQRHGAAIRALAPADPATRPSCQVGAKSHGPCVSRVRGSAPTSGGPPPLRRDRGRPPRRAGAGDGPRRRAGPPASLPAARRRGRAERPRPAPSAGAR